MSAPIDNRCIFKNEAYSIIALENPLTFDPVDYGVLPIPYFSACTTGYFCEFVLNTHLRLRHLYVTAEHYPQINGINAEINKQDFFFGAFHVYRNIDISLDYSGGMIIGKDVVPNYYKYERFQRPYAYNKVFEVIFEKGNLKWVSDCSQKIKEFRKESGFGEEINVNLEEISSTYDIFIRSYEKQEKF